jgi:hypothetical protein
MFTTNNAFIAAQCDQAGEVCAMEVPATAKASKRAGHTFTMRDRANKPYGDPVPYTPIRVVVAGKQHDLALHKSGAQWQVSDPLSGGRVCDVTGLYRGIRVSSRGIGTREAKTLAIAQVQAKAERIGSDRFNAVMAAGKMA